MSTTIKVWLDDRPGIEQDMGWATVLAYEPAPPHNRKPCTIVIHDKAHEPVTVGKCWTNEQVKAMVKEILNAAGEIQLNEDGSMRGDFVDVAWIKSIAAKHDITL